MKFQPINLPDVDMKRPIVIGTMQCRNRRTSFDNSQTVGANRYRIFRAGI